MTTHDTPHDAPFRVGDLVETAVFVGRQRRPTGKGRVTTVHSGYCDVDICPEGEPWIVPFSHPQLRRLSL